MPTKKTVLTTAFALYLFSQVFFLIGIQFPGKLNFDEFHYIPSAKQWLALVENRNWEHPPLAKLLIAVGVGLGGDRPFGWRVASTLFGSLTVVGMYLWGLALFRRQRLALFAVFLTFVNNLLYVQARIAMLDTFMMAFLVFGFAGVTEYLRGVQERKYLRGAGVAFALATACKWFALMPWLACALLIALYRFLSLIPRPWYEVGKGKVSISSESLDAPLFIADNHRRMKPAHLWVDFLGLPVIAYFATFIPYYFVTPHDPQKTLGFLDLFRMQAKMYDGQLRVVTKHPYMSTWLDWPLLLRPIWYAFDHVGAAKEWVRGVIMLGNPFLMWSGLGALAYAIFDFLRRRRFIGFFVTYCFASVYLCWGVIPRKISFYYYYYPAGMVLSLVITYALYCLFDEKVDRVKDGPVSVDEMGAGAWIRWTYAAVALGFFVYFFPILAGLKIPAGSFTKWMWLGRRWI